MRFTVLGSGTTLPDPDRGPAGFLVRAGGRSILVDGGGGTIQRLARAGVDARTLDGGVYSHRHLDHAGELAPLLFTMRVGVDRPRDRDYPIWAGQGMRAHLEALDAVYGGKLRGRTWGPVVHELPLDGPGRARLPGGVRLDTLPARHTQGALHLRFTGPEGATVVFSGDTGPSENLVTLARGADLLVTECALAGPPVSEPAHLWPDAIHALVAAARPRRVLLTHLYPDVDPDRALRVVAEAGVPVERAWDGQTVDVTPTRSSQGASS
ncbi:MAG: ribonuclease Z [Alphaproteobacteria bacterium]|nr:ribonuclease Z [Alphaproteobacteria bacterium]